MHRSTKRVEGRTVVNINMKKDERTAREAVRGRRRQKLPGGQGKNSFQKGQAALSYPAEDGSENSPGGEQSGSHSFPSRDDAELWADNSLWIKREVTKAAGESRVEGGAGRQGE